jgi:hypothetical protein
MKSAQPWSFESTANGSEPHKFYPFKGVNVFHPIFDSKVNTKDRFQREVKEFENHKKVQVLNELEDAMPGFRTATEYHDTGMTRFEHILSHYSKDMTYKPGSDHIRMLEPKPDMLTVHTMMGYNKHKDPATFENLTHGTLPLTRSN